MLLCFISTTFWQCQKEEFETTESAKQGKLNLWVVPGEKAFNNSKQLRERVTSLKRKNTAARLTSTIYNFSIEEEHVQIIIGDDYTQYTFNIERENPTPNLLENYVCKIYTDGEVFQYLMGYPYTIGQNGIAYQMQNSTIEAISDGDIIVTTAGRGFPPGCVPEFLYEILTYECTNYSCSGDGRHMPGEECPCGTPISPKCNQPYTNCGWITTAVCGGCGGGGSTGGDGGFTPPAGGGPGGSGTTTPVDPVVTVPFDGELELDDDCNTSKEDLKKLFPNASDANLELLANVINAKGKDFGINNKEKLQHFLSQAGHEVGEFTGGIGRTENTSYTTKARILKVFGKYFSETDTITKRKPDNYVNNPSALANYVYCCRMGNGTEESGDGYKYRGRGIFQLTGKTNYSNFQNYYNSKYNPDKDFLNNPELLKTNDTIAIISAMWFYQKNVMNTVVIDSTTTVKKITKKINGGINGLSHRESIFNVAKDSINCI
ncbi:glycoside hydrolase family 19 protein [Flavobacterium sp.]|jgi:putative chitinase|uniref:glycoside hydrolase family 19 protein n=1 Tax=Flavobacterium sp. TaxID=239 RepID=UPI0037C12B6E